MYCKKCGKELKDTSKICSYCDEKSSNDTYTDSHKKPKRKWLNPGTIIFIVFFVVLSAWGSINDDTVTHNDNALKSFDSGDANTAIAELQQATDSAVTDYNRIETLKNLGYVYSSELRYDEALEAFEEALELTNKDSFDFYLISGEIAALKYQPSIAISNYDKAYKLQSRDFQINNALTLFYLDIEDVWPQYSDYSKALSYALSAYEYDVSKSEISKQNLAIAYTFNERYDDAIELFLTTNAEQHPYIYYWLGTAYAFKGDDVNGKFYFRKAIDAGVPVEDEVYEYLNTY